MGSVADGAGRGADSGGERYSSMFVVNTPRTPWRPAIAELFARGAVVRKQNGEWRHYLRRANVIAVE